MKKFLNKIIDFVNKLSLFLLELINQYFFYILFFCIFFNLIIVIILCIDNKIIILLVILFIIFVFIQLLYLIRVNIIKFYQTANNKILFLNIILLLLNILTVFLMYSYIYVNTLNFLYQNLIDLYNWIILKLK